jgi:hypothetical protein
MRVPTDFCIDQQKETIINILNDAIIFERILRGMQETAKAANPKCEDWDPIHFYNGIANAWIFLVGYEFQDDIEESLKDELTDIFFKYFKKDIKKPFDKRKNANILAQLIFIEWNACIDRTGNKSKSA